MNMDAFVHYVYHSAKNIALETASHFRLNDRYDYIRQLRGEYSGERCFVLATGPSMCISDMEMLSNEFTFGMNSLCLAYSQTSFRPSIYMVQDTSVYKKVEPVLIANPDNVIVSSFVAKLFPIARQFKQFPINSEYMLFDYVYTDKLPIKFSEDASRVIYDAYSITFSIIQLAVYMGFSEIYLLGCDCNQQPGKQNHFLETGHVEEASKLQTSAYRNLYAHEHAKVFCEAHGVKIFNATRGGNLEVYPRVTLEDVLGYSTDISAN